MSYLKHIRICFFIFSLILSVGSISLPAISLAKEHTWDGNQYRENKSIQFLGALDQIKDVSFQGDESILDIGCGDGEITSILASKTTGPVLGLDLNTSMINHAVAHYRKPNLEFIRGDATEITYLQKFDLITSFNAFHWISDQDLLLKKVYSSLKPQGHIVLGMPTTVPNPTLGTSLMVQLIREVSQSAKWSVYLKDFRPQWHFFSANEYSQWVTQAGFVAVEVKVTLKPFTLPNEAAFINWMKPIVPQLKLLPQELQLEFLKEVSGLYLSRVPLTPKGEVALSHAQLEVKAQRK